jgi:hypothetical protein
MGRHFCQRKLLQEAEEANKEGILEKAGSEVITAPICPER